MNRWITHFEHSGGVSTPDYQETQAYFQALAESSPHARLVPIGKSSQERELTCLIASRTRRFTPSQARRERKAVVLIQNGIHGGETEGKDASMLLLRDILVTGEKRQWLDHLVLLVLPVLNVDGHERRSSANRPNQNGPLETGWRTTALNLNVNRDYMKADTPEMRALLSLFHKWSPDLMIDTHTTNGADFQYHILYGIETAQNMHPAPVQWMTSGLIPFMTGYLSDRGFLTAPYNESNDLRNGIVCEPSLPRYSTGYAAIHNRICVMTEAHSLKPYDTRVHATKSMIEAILEFTAAHHESLLRVNRLADGDSVRRFCLERQPYPISLRLTGESQPFPFLGIASYEEPSIVTGDEIVRYTGEPITQMLPLHLASEVEEAVIVPELYAIPVEFPFVIELLQVHGVSVSVLQTDFTTEAETYSFNNVSLAHRPYEGRIRASFRVDSAIQVVNLRAGTYLVDSNQAGLGVILHLLEPNGKDSLAQWGFFHAFLERKEYAEPYIMEPIARRMMEADELLRAEFSRRLEEEEAFRNDPPARLDFFYSRSPFRDPMENRYPILRLWNKIIRQHARSL